MNFLQFFGFLHFSGPCIFAIAFPEHRIFLGSFVISEPIANSSSLLEQSPHTWVSLIVPSDKLDIRHPEMSAKMHLINGCSQLQSHKCKITKEDPFLHRKYKWNYTYQATVNNAFFHCEQSLFVLICGLLSYAENYKRKKQFAYWCSAVASVTFTSCTEQPNKTFGWARTDLSVATVKFTTMAFGLLVAACGTISSTQLIEWIAQPASFYMKTPPAARSRLRHAICCALDMVSGFNVV